MSLCKLATAICATAYLSVGFWYVPSHAALLTWKLQGVTFVDPAALVTVTGTGSFVYNADTHKVTDWDIVVSGDPTSGVQFHFAPHPDCNNPAPCLATASRDPGPIAGTDLFSFNLNSVPDASASLSLVTERLTNDGGIRPLIDTAGPEFFCCGINLISADVTSGLLTAVPEPTTAAWFAFALGVVSAFFGERRSQSSKAT